MQKWFTILSQIFSSTAVILCLSVLRSFQCVYSHFFSYCIFSLAHLFPNTKLLFQQMCTKILNALPLIQFLVFTELVLLLILAPATIRLLTGPSRLVTRIQLLSLST